jgi:hypothetical protein
VAGANVLRQRAISKSKSTDDRNDPQDVHEPTYPAAAALELRTREGAGFALSGSGMRLELGHAD